MSRLADEDGIAKTAADVSRALLSDNAFERRLSSGPPSGSIEISTGTTVGGGSGYGNGLSATKRPIAAAAWVRADTPTASDGVLTSQSFPLHSVSRLTGAPADRLTQTRQFIIVLR